MFLRLLINVCVWFFYRVYYQFVQRRNRRLWLTSCFVSNSFEITFVPCIRFKKFHPSCCKGFLIPLFHSFLKSLVVCSSECSALVADVVVVWITLVQRVLLKLTSVADNYTDLLMCWYTFPNPFGNPRYTFLISRGSFGEIFPPVYCFGAGMWLCVHCWLSKFYKNPERNWLWIVCRCLW